MLDRMIRDKFVCGIRDTDEQKLLLAQPELTLKETESIVRVAETAAQDVKEVKQSESAENTKLNKLTEKVRKFKSGKMERRSRGQTN